MRAIREEVRKIKEDNLACRNAQEMKDLSEAIREQGETKKKVARSERRRKLRTAMECREFYREIYEDEHQNFLHSLKHAPLLRGASSKTDHAAVTIYQPPKPHSSPRNLSLDEHEERLEVQMQERSSREALDRVYKKSSPIFISAVPCASREKELTLVKQWLLTDSTSRSTALAKQRTSRTRAVTRKVMGTNETERIRYFEFLRRRNIMKQEYGLFRAVLRRELSERPVQPWKYTPSARFDRVVRVRDEPKATNSQLPLKQAVAQQARNERMSRLLRAAQEEAGAVRARRLSVMRQRSVERPDAKIADELHSELLDLPDYLRSSVVNIIRSEGSEM